jgi:glycosyltransferase involved in cell wall biosynthesis
LRKNWALRNTDHSFKAIRDVNKLFKELPYFYPLDYQISRNFLSKSLRLSQISLLVLLRLRKSDKFFYNFPPTVLDLPIILSAMLKRANCVAIIHDLDYLRNLPNRSMKIIMDPYGFKILKKSFVVSQNSAMTDELSRHGVLVKEEIGFFPYLLEEVAPTLTHVTNSSDIDVELIYAGNLKTIKSPFLGTYLKDFVPITLYGVNFPDSLKGVVPYEGYFDPSHPPQMLTPKFGLVWDGESCESLQGSFGEYLYYNSPHKASLYIAMGIPVIVSEESALADIVDNLGIGLTVPNISSVPRTITSSEYLTLKSKVESFRAEIVSGKLFADLLKRISNLPQN